MLREKKKGRHMNCSSGTRKGRKAGGKNRQGIAAMN
jgi:hypothetical protein